MKTDREIMRWAARLCEAFDSETIIFVPAYGADPARFGQTVNSAFGRDFYEEFVPDEYEEKGGTRHTYMDPGDDQDIYSVNRRDTLGEEDFWSRVLDAAWDEFGDEGVEVRAGELRDCVEKAAARIADEAWNEYRPGEDELVRKAGGGRF